MMKLIFVIFSLLLMLLVVDVESGQYMPLASTFVCYEWHLSVNQVYNL